MGKCILAGHPPVGGQTGCGTYIGDGAATRTISLGITPKWVIAAHRGTEFGAWGNSWCGGGIAIQGTAAISDERTICEIVENGFQVFYNANGAFTNSSGQSYTYIYGT